MAVLTCTKLDGDGDEAAKEYLALLLENLFSERSRALSTAAMFALYQISLFDDELSPSIVARLMDYTGPNTRVQRVTLLCILRHEKNEPFSDQLCNILSSQRLETPPHQV
jgi:hypothetical protein